MPLLRDPWPSLQSVDPDSLLTRPRALRISLVAPLPCRRTLSRSSWAKVCGFPSSVLARGTAYLCTQKLCGDSASALSPFQWCVVDFVLFQSTNKSQSDFLPKDKTLAKKFLPMRTVFLLSAEIGRTKTKKSPPGRRAWLGGGVASMKDSQVRPIRRPRRQQYTSGRRWDQDYWQTWSCSQGSFLP